MSDIDHSGIPRRTVRSFVRRSGRITPSQEKALRELWPRYGLEYSPRELQLPDAFVHAGPCTLEIGFGNGDSLVQQAAEHPERNFIGLEVHEPGIGHCLIAAHDAGVENLRLIAHDAIEVLQQQIPTHSLARINLYFPDPWPKKRHHKRRIVQHAFLELCAERLAPGGALHVATDWENYAEHIDETLAETDLFGLGERRVHDGDRALDRPSTKFEQRGLRKGHRIWDWRFDCLDR